MSPDTSLVDVGLADVENHGIVFGQYRRKGCGHTGAVLAADVNQYQFQVCRNLFG